MSRNALPSIAALTLAVVTLTYADPALGGGRGLCRIQDGRVEDAGALVFSSRWAFNRDYLGGTDGAYRGPLYGMEMNYAPLQVLEVSGSLLGVLDSRPDFFFYDHQGYMLGGKLSIPSLPIVTPGVSLSYVREKTGRDPKGGRFQSFLDDHMPKGLSWRGLATLRFAELHKTLPNLILNYGENLEHGRLPFAGAGLEVTSDVLCLFLEASSEAKHGFDFLSRDAGIRITPGVRIKLPYVHIDGGIEFGVTDPVPDYKGVAGLTLTSPFPRVRPQPSGRFAGRVVDACTGSPLDAQVAFRGKTIRPLQTDPENGVFYVEKVPVGVLVAEATAEGYMPEATPLAVADGNLATYTFELRPVPPASSGLLFGKVLDRKSREPKSAVVRFVKGEHPPVNAAPDNGDFAITLPSGAHDVYVEAEGYEPLTTSVTVVDGDSTRHDFELVSRGMSITLRGVYFELNTAELKPESYFSLMEAAQIMKENPGIAVEIQGHTDATGSDVFNARLSEKRAYAVVNFLVRHGGVDARRLTAKGYGESCPAFPNDVREGRQLNRRVEFAVAR